MNVKVKKISTGRVEGPEKHNKQDAEVADESDINCA